MAIQNTTTKTDVYQGDGESTEFTFSFRISSQSDLKVYVKKGLGAFELQELNQDYELEVTTDSAGNITSGKIIYPKTDESLTEYDPQPLTDEDYIYAIRETPKTQLEDHTQASFKSDDMERALDKVTMEVQELTEEVGRCVKTEAWQDIDPDEIIESIYDAVGDAGDYATAAQGYAGNASEYATNASNSAGKAQKWAEGSDSDVSALGGTHSAKGWAEIAQSAAQSGGANTSLSNLNATGEARFTAKANTDLSNASTTTAILNTVFPAAVDYVVETQLPTSANNYTWKRVYRSKWVEQGGRYLLQGTKATITLPKEMADTNYSTCVTPISNNDVNWPIAWSPLSTRTTTTIELDGTEEFGQASRNIWVQWEVRGQGA